MDPIPTIAAEWAGYAGMVPGLPPSVAKHLRRAFYAGFLSAMGGLGDAVNSANKDDVKKYVDDRFHELEDFKNKILTGTE